MKKSKTTKSEYTPLTLEQTWKTCIAMWKWIVKERSSNKYIDVPTLKEYWLSEHGYVNVRTNCVFCDYAARRTDGDRCLACPGALVDKNFRCGNGAYNYYDTPDLFLKELRRLYKIRQLVLKKKRLAEQARRLRAKENHIYGYTRASNK